MKRLWLVLSSLMLAFLTATAFAQQEAAPGPGYGHMMWGGGGDGGWHSGMIFGPIAMLLAFVGIVALIVLLVRIFSHGGYHHHGVCPRCGHGRGRGALDILEERFARGEIGKDEFEEKRKLLGR